MTGAYANQSVVELARAIRTGSVSPVEVVEASLNRIEARTDDINAFVTVAADGALQAAREAEMAVEEGEVSGPLHGIPVAIKDSTAVADVPMTHGTTLLENHIPAEDASVVTRLRTAGAIVIGKSNLAEFGLYGGTHNKLIGATGNPFDPAKTTTGSSGGSAAAVADGQVPLAQGSDGGGSLRMPASACGIYTIKPTFGLVGRHQPGRTNAFGHTPMLSSGPMARWVEDAAVMLDVMAGSHPRDPFSVPNPDADYRAATQRSVDDLTVGYSPALDVYPIDPRVREIVDDAVTAIEAAGATVTEVTPVFGYDRKELGRAFMTGSSVWTAGYAEWLADEHDIDILGQDRGAILPYLLEQFEAGYDPSALEYQRADIVRTDVYDTVQAILEDHDLLACATLLVPPFDNQLHTDRPGPERVGETRIDTHRWGTLLDWRTTQLFNMTGHPAASIPAGFTDGGLPVGLQLVGDRFDESTVLAASAAYERVKPWQDSYPFVPS